MQSAFPSFGEVFITNDEVQGAMENLRMFKGKLISNICGGCKKLFIIEEGSGNEGIISTLHGPESDTYDKTFTESQHVQKSEFDPLQAFDNKGQIKKIATGKKHTIFLTEDGKVFSYGYGEFGTLGHGGMIETQVPKPIGRLLGRPVIQIACGEFHTLVLTNTRDMYAWGRGFEGQLGVRNDVDSASIPMFVPFFYKNPATFIACGAYHSLAINDKGRLYAWGESRFGQVGNGKKVKETLPILVNLTPEQREEQQQEIEKQRELREKRRQIKLRRKLMNQLSEQVSPQGVLEADQLVEEVEIEQDLSQLQMQEPQRPPQVQTSQSQFKVAPLTNLQAKPYPKILNVSAGYGHTACITDNGDLYTFGFNQRGQLGHGDAKSRYEPTMVTKDLLGNQVPLFERVSCGYYTTYAIDQAGHLWSWGGGNLGHKGDKLIDLPRRVIDNTENRKFVNIMANGQAAVFFAQLRTLSIRPNYGPSCGGTLLTLIGTGFCDTGRQSVRFTYGSRCVEEVGCTYDDMTDSFSCTTPHFEERSEDEVLQWPLECKVEVTLDGVIYLPCEQVFLIYSSKLNISTLFPKCASVEGGTSLVLNINIDDKTASYMKHLNIGFQPKSKKDKDNNKKPALFLQSNNQTVYSKKPSQQDLVQPKVSLHSNNFNNNEEKQKNQLNPLDLSTNDPELEKENWICVEGFYEKGKISCTVPNVSNSVTDILNYNVDVSINGQQFTGNPVVFRFYDIKVNSITPDNVMSESGTTVRIEGEGFFDTTNKKVIFKTAFGERLIEITWDKQDRCYSLVAPPITWLLGGQQPTPELLAEVKRTGVEALLTLSGVEWIYVGKFYYIDPEVTRIAPVIFEAGINEEEKKHRWLSPQEEVDILSQIANEQERAKKAEELKKLLEAEDNEILTMFKKAGKNIKLIKIQGAYLYLFGSNFINTQSLLVQFIYNNKTKVVKGVYKNPSKIGVQVPELDDLNLGIHEVQVEITLNAQQFSHSKKQFRYLSFDKTMTTEQKQKFEDEEIKKLKKPPGKK